MKQRWIASEARCICTHVSSSGNPVYYVHHTWRPRSPASILEAFATVIIHSAPDEVFFMLEEAAQTTAARWAEWADII
eukprot:6492306-Amphidinium_carterae.5